MIEEHDDTLGTSFIAPTSLVGNFSTCQSMQYEVDNLIVDMPLYCQLENDDNVL